MWIPEFSNLLLQATGTTSLWILILLAVRRPLSRHLGARWAYRLWFAPILALIASATSGLHEYSLIPASGIWNGIEVLSWPQVEINSGELSGAPAAHGVANTIVGSGLLLATWAAGFLLSLTASLWRAHGAYRADLLDSVTPNVDQQRQIEDLMAAIGNRPLPPIRILRRRLGPAVAGNLHPILLLTPAFLSEFPRPQQLLMLQHELHHIRRRDLLWLNTARVFRCLFWFNPLVYIAERRFTEDLELSCDEAVLGRTNTPTRRQYGEALVALASHQEPVRHALLSSTYRILKERTQMLGKHRPPGTSRIIGTIFLTTVLSLSATFGMSDSATENLTPDQPSLAAQLDKIAQRIENAEANQGELADAQSELAKLELQVEPREVSDSELAQILDLRAYAYYKAKDYDRAIQLLERILALNGISPARRASDQFTLSQMYFANGDYDQALEGVNKLKDFLGKETDKTLWFRAQVYYQQGQFEKAVEYTDRYIAQLDARDEFPSKNALVFRAALFQKLGDESGLRQTQARLDQLYPEE